MDSQVNEDIKFESNINLKGIKDITLANGQRIIIMFKNNSNTPTVINIDPNMNLNEEVKRKQEEYIKYQGLDAIYNTETILDDIAKESNSYETIRVLDKNYTISEQYRMNPEKLKKISALIKKANEKNAILPDNEKYAYIDEENDYVISMTGKVLEAEFDSLRNETIVESPENASEFKDQELGENEELQEKSEEVKDEEYSDDEIENIYEEVFYKGGISEDSKEEIISNLKKVAKDPNYIESIPTTQRDWYYTAYDKMETLKKNKTKTLSLAPNNNQSGVSNYLYIAIIVLFIAFIIFMYIIFRR